MKDKSWRYVFVGSILLYVGAIVLSVFLIRSIPSMYVDLQKKEELKVKNEIEQAITTNSDYQKIIDTHFVDFVVYNQTTKQTIFSSLKLDNGKLDLNQTSNDRVISSKRVVNYTNNNQAYEVYIVQYYLSPQSTFDIWLKVLGIIIGVLLSVVIIAISILFYKYVKPLNRLKNTVQQVSAFSLNQLKNINKNSEYDKLTNDLYKFTQELKDNLSETGYKYNQLETSLLKQNEDMAYKNRLLASLSHDLKAPIAIIRLQMAKLSNETNVEQLAQIDEKIEALILEVNDINKIAYANNNSIHQEQDIDMIELILNANDVFEELLNERNLIIEFDFDAQLIYHTNLIQVKQIINNAFSNMYSHAKPDSEVVVKAYKKDDKLIMSFYNECEALNDNDLNNIFELFYVSSTNKTSSGMGLYLMKKVVEDLQGDISLTNYQAGLILKVVLPYEKTN